MTFAATILAAAASDVPKNEFGHWDGGLDQWWMDVLASGLTGLMLLPFVSPIVWGLHRLKLDRWLIVSAALATVLTVVISSTVHEFVAPIFVFLGQMLDLIGVYRFQYLLMPLLLVCYAEALALGMWFKYRERSKLSEVSK